MASRVAPTAGDELSFLDELAPADPLPVVDLSVSLKSRYLKGSLATLLTRWIRRRRLIFVCYALGQILGATVAICNARVGRPLAVVCWLLQIHAPLAGLAVLRFFMVQELVKTFDFWFFFTTAAWSMGLLAAQLHDARVCGIFIIWISLLPNLLNDANLRGNKFMVLINLGAIAVCLTMMGVMKIRGIDGATNFALLRHGKREVPSSDFIFNGMVTIVTMLARNVVRLQDVFVTHGRIREIHCVSYRSSLCLIPRINARRLSAHLGRPALATENPMPVRPSRDHLQPLRLKKGSEIVDARLTIWPLWPHSLVVSSGLLHLGHQAGGIGSFLLSIVASSALSAQTVSRENLVVLGKAAIACTCILDLHRGFLSAALAVDACDVVRLPLPLSANLHHPPDGVRLLRLGSSVMSDVAYVVVVDPLGFVR